MFKAQCMIYPLLFTLSQISDELWTEKHSKLQYKYGIEGKVLASQYFNKVALNYTKEVILWINKKEIFSNGEACFYI